WMDTWTSIRIRARHHRQGEPQIRRARGTHRCVQSGWHNLGRAADVHAGHVRAASSRGHGAEGPEDEGRRALQDRALRRPGGDGQADGPGPREDPRHHPHGYDGRGFPDDRPGLDRQGEAPALRAPLHRARLSADARSDAIPARERLQDLLRHRRGQDFVPTYAEKVYGVPPEQVVGSAADTKFGYDKNGKATLTKVPKVLLIDDKVSQPGGIHLMIGRRAVAGFGYSAGDQQMLEYTQAGDGARLMMLVHHDDGQARRRLRAEVEGWHLPRRADGRGQEARLGRHQHAER